MIQLTVEIAPKMEWFEYWIMEIRCVSDIRKGNRLLKSVPYLVNPSDGSTTLKNELEFSIDLVVDRILSWEKEWDLAYAGMAAKILVKGDASRLVAKTFCFG